MLVPPSMRDGSHVRHLYDTGILQESLSSSVGCLTELLKFVGACRYFNSWSQISANGRLDNEAFVTYIQVVIKYCIFKRDLRPECSGY